MLTPHTEPHVHSQITYMQTHFLAFLPRLQAHALLRMHNMHAPFPNALSALQEHKPCFYSLEPIIIPLGQKETCCPFGESKYLPTKCWPGLQRYTPQGELQPPGHLRGDHLPSIFRRGPEDLGNQHGPKPLTQCPGTSPSPLPGSVYRTRAFRRSCRTR